MSQLESCQDRQNNEFEVLKSIFGDDLKDLRNNKIARKRKWQPMDLSITLTPSQGMSGPVQVYAQIDLRVTCGDTYPEDVPHLQLKNSLGLSDEQIGVLYSEVKDLADKLKGEVMIYELSQHIQKFLHTHNKPSYESFYEEMVSRREEKIQSEMQKKQLKENHERQVLQDEIQRRQETLKAESRDRKRLSRTSMESNTISQSFPSSPQERVRAYSRRRCLSTSESSGNLSCEAADTKVLNFLSNKDERQVHLVKCLGHSAKGSIIYAGVDIVTVEHLAVTEWPFKFSPREERNSESDTLDLQQLMKQVGSIEQELYHLQKLDHPNLVHYLNIKYLQNKNSVVVYILQEFVVGTTCSFFQKENIPVNIDMLRYLATGVLGALEYLHDNNIAHKDLTDSSIYIDNTGVVRVSNYSLTKRLSDIYRSCCLGKVNNNFSSIQEKGEKELDIYRFGTLLLTLLKVKIVSDNEGDWGLNLPSTLRDFLSKCLNRDEKLRWSAKQLQQHSFIRTPIINELSLPKCYDNEDKNSESEEPTFDFKSYLPTLDSNSRFKNEFEILKLLGEGAFGDVWKVRNKLDGRFYAIKRIALNPKISELNKKMIREVKLLSRLNHENVVRYYNSWIENVTVNKVRGDSTSSSEITTVNGHKVGDLEKFKSERIIKLLTPVNDVEWTVSFENPSNVASDEDYSSNFSDEDTEDESESFHSPQKSLDDSDSIEFKIDSESQIIDSKAESYETSEKITSEENSIIEHKTKFMYIQMEFCEKSTLRTAIDNNLYEDKDRVWRLFREMVEGIAYIHQQGMIHRDLKPVNIFLDSNDHVKIGDFGLATTNILCSIVQTIDSEKEAEIENKNDIILDEPRSMTGQVGTALYVAPELRIEVAKARYNQKVDIYSLGIILFEMCYKPPETKMERVTILQKVRSKEIILPSDMTETEMPHQIHLLRWLLNHDPSQRPTAQELLTSEYLPPPLLVEAELQEMVQHTLSNSQSKAYKYMIACCFAQEVTPAEDITYDMNLPSRPATNSVSVVNELLHEHVKSKVIDVFQRHGGVYLVTPLLMPKSGQLYDLTETCVKLMTHSGSIVTIPHDLRAPFARYVARNNILHFRRYAIERVFREKKVHGFHPRELYECAFDIISSTVDLMAEAELIRISCEIFNEFSELCQRDFTVRINHTSLLHAVLMYCGIGPEKYQDIFSILCDARDGKCSKLQVQTHFISLCLTDQAMETLLNLFDTENNVSKIASILKTITKRKGDAAVLAKNAIREIETVTAHVKALGVKWSIVIVPLLAHNMKQHSGIIFQISCDLKRKRRSAGQDVIAAGGRYDNMLQSFKEISKRSGSTNKEVSHHGVGLSISLDKLVCAIQEVILEDTNNEISINRFRIDVAVGFIDSKPEREHELADLFRELWSLGLRVTKLDFCRTEEILEYCRENLIPHVIILHSGIGNLILHSWEYDKFKEQKICITEITEHLQRQTDTLPVLNRSDSKIRTTDSTNSSSSYHNINFNFIPTERDKLSDNVRRNYKNTMLAQMSASLQRISCKVSIEVFALFLEMPVIRTLFKLLEIDEKEQDFQKSIQLVIEEHLHQKKYIEQVCDKIWELRNEKQRPVLVLYSLIDNHYIIFM
ncbi:eIF-2-alpha kinase GCN2 [Microplitis demolitor]|uniref:eIF-2-alpha kinase GCN2 n=1 Tax=Microplitis demolitor TaxID=69319 RepID=UPI0004CD240A|nr:eIF-2-alpha kinase GCN2 [Microplitis demolitor]